MAVDKQEFAGGTVLTGKYKKETYRCEVVEQEGKTLFSLNGKTYKSLSAAAAAITGGAVNGWKFWTLETAGEPPAPHPTPTRPLRPPGSLQRANR